MWSEVPPAVTPPAYPKHPTLLRQQEVEALFCPLSLSVFLTWRQDLSGEKPKFTVPLGSSHGQEEEPRAVAESLEHRVGDPRANQKT